MYVSITPSCGGNEMLSELYEDDGRFLTNGKPSLIWGIELRDGTS